MDLSGGRSIVVGFKEIECDVQGEGATAKERVPVSFSRFAMERERDVDSVFDLWEQRLAEVLFGFAG